MTIERKQFLPQIKAADEGKATFVVATLNTIDKDHDVTLPGFFGQQVVQAVGAHDWGSVPIGKARIYESGDVVLADLQFNDTTAGVDWYRSIKFDFATPPAKQEYSYGFQIREGGQERGMFQGKPVRFLKGLEDGTPGADVIEVSPVLRGAGQGTRTLVVKEDPIFSELPIDLSDLKQEGFQIQSLIFPKAKWDSADAVRAWCRSHDFATTLDETENSWRARQRDPGDFERIRTICLDPSRDASPEECRVSAVGGPLKELRAIEPVVQEAKRLIGIHHTDTDDRIWDAVMAQRYVKSTAHPGYYRQIYAFRDGADDMRKQSYRFLHHFVHDNGEAGAASVRACLQHIATLNKGVIRESERQGIYAHMAAHLKDAGREPPELRTSESLQYPMDAQIELTLWELEAVIHQIDHIRDLRQRKGMTLTQARMDQLKHVQEKFELLCRLIALKAMDRQVDEVSEEMTLAARAEAMGQRITEMRTRVQQQASESAQAAAAQRFERFQNLQRETRR